MDVDKLKKWLDVAQQFQGENFWSDIFENQMGHPGQSSQNPPAQSQSHGQGNMNPPAHPSPPVTQHQQQPKGTHLNYSQSSTSQEDLNGRQQEKKPIPRPAIDIIETETE